MKENKGNWKVGLGWVETPAGEVLPFRRITSMSEKGFYYEVGHHQHLIQFRETYSPDVVGARQIIEAFKAWLDNRQGISL